MTAVSGYAEREAAITMIESHRPDRRRLTVGADTGYDAAKFVKDLRALNVTPHLAQNDQPRSANDGRPTRQPAYAAIQQKRIEGKRPVTQLRRCFQASRAGVRRSL